MRSRAIGFVALLALSVGVSACGDSTGSVGDTARAGTTSGAAPDPTQAESAADASPTVTPASGPLVDVRGMTAHLPDLGRKWRRVANGISTATSVFLDEGVATIIFSDMETGGSGLAHSTKVARDQILEQAPQAKQLANRLVDGVEVYAFEWVGEGDLNYEIGGIHNGHSFSIDFDFPQKYPESHQRIEEVLASVKFR